MLSNVYKPDGGSTRNRHGQNLYFEFGRNFGFFEISPVIHFSSYDYESYKTDSLGYGLSGSYNFIENKIGNNLIPFAQLAVLKDKTSETWPSSSSNNDWTDESTIFNVGTGIKYFPFGQILSLETVLRYRTTNGKYDETNSIKFDYKKTGLNLDFSALIYF